MSGEENLAVMLQTMSPQVNPGEFVYCSFPDGNYGDHQALSPVAAYVEREGLTLVLPRSRADEHGLPYESVFRCITLMVHSSLMGVGLTAAVSTRLAHQGISANMMAGYYHDHIFIPVADADRALQALVDLANDQ